MFDVPRLHSSLADLLAHLRQAGYQFTTITPATHARVLQRGEEGSTLRDVFGWSRWCSQALLPAALFEQLRKDGLIIVEETRWRSRVRVSSLDDLLLVHSAYPTVEPDAVFFGPDTYRFVGAIQRWMHGKAPCSRVVDIGCGSGAAGLAIARAWPDARVQLTDINARALAFTGLNAQAANLANVSVSHSDILKGVDGEFDLIVANPPYMADPLKRNYRDGGGADGCDLSVRIIAESVERLAPGGTLLLYTGTPIREGRNVLSDDAAAVLNRFAGPWSIEELDPDVFGEELDGDAYRHADRIAVVLLTLRKTDR